jgi:hypothetical protein
MNERLVRALFLAILVCLTGLIGLVAGCGGGSGSSTSSTTNLTSSVSTLTAGSTVQIILTNSGTTEIAQPSVSLASWLNSIVLSPQLLASSSLLPGASVSLAFTLGTDSTTLQALSDNYQYILSNPSSNVMVVNSASVSAGVRPALEVNAVANPIYQTLLTDVLINADLWSDTAQIMSANYAFESIEGVGTLSDTDPVEASVIAAGGTWETIVTAHAASSAYTTAATPSGVSRLRPLRGYPFQFHQSIRFPFNWQV